MTQGRGALAGRLLAELALVIVGVLIALQLEARRQVAASARLETAQLIALRSDFLENRTRLDSVQALQDSVVDSGRLLVQLHARQTERPTAIALASSVTWALAWWRFEPVSGAYDAMVSSGDITRLTNQDLLRRLASFYGDVRVEFEDQAESMALLAELRRIQVRYGLGALAPRIFRGYDVSWTPNAAALSALVSDGEFAGMLAIRTRMETNRAELYQRLDQDIDYVITVIDAELASRSAL